MKNENTLHITFKHTGKMEGMQSLSTACIKNEICKARAAVPGSICQKCYAARQLAYQGTTRKALEKNSELLSRPLKKEEIPKINASVFRFEAFGDLSSTTQFENYCKIAAANKKTRFALWTKNAGIIKQAINQGVKKPGNLIIIYSSPMLNSPSTKAFEIWPFIDKVFTVFDKNTIAENGVIINCGARNCFECGKCYSKRTAQYINEILK